MAFELDPEIRRIPKAELHVHIEGTVTPEMARQKAQENNVTLDPAIFSADGSRFQWKNFFHLVTEVYDNMAQALRTKKDYEDITYDYLTRCAAEGSIYEELICWASQGDAVGLSYKDMVDGMAAGIDRAEKDTGIIARLNSTLVRHQPFDKVAQEAAMIASYPHPYIVGLDIAGGESAGDIPKYQPLFDMIFQHFNRPLGMRLHAGEAVGPENVRDALALTPQPTRIGHGVRSAEDPALMQKLAADGVMLEVCPTSNVLANIYPSYADHPLPVLLAAGVKMCLNSDDPGLFGDSIGEVYQVSRDQFGLSDTQLLQMTKNAVDGCFAGDAVKAKLHAKIRAYEAGFFKPARTQGPGMAP